MPLMRDKESGVVREVHPRYLARFPDEYEPTEVEAVFEVPQGGTVSMTPDDGGREVKVRLVAPGAFGYLKAADAASKNRPSNGSAASPTGANGSREGEE